MVKYSCSRVERLCGSPKCDGVVLRCCLAEICEADWRRSRGDLKNLKFVLFSYDGAHLVY